MPPKASKPTSVPPSQHSLDGWLSLPSTSSSLSTPKTAPFSVDASLITYSKCILEKDSIFIATAFPLQAPPTTSHIQTILNKHLSPPRHPSLPAVVQRNRGINPSHRMYAWRVLGLKEGKDGTGGAGDYEVKEGSEDDDERWGGDRILKVLRDLEGVDCLVVCSRWFGGTMIGPIRFEHIQNSSREALAAHLALADLQPFLVELRARDAHIQHLRTLLSGPAKTKVASSSSSPAKDPYEGLTLERAERLLVARGKTLEMLEKKAKEERVEEEPDAGRRHLKRTVERLVLDAEDEEEEEEDVSLVSEKTHLPPIKKRKPIVDSGDDDGDEVDRRGGGATAGQQGDDDGDVEVIDNSDDG